MKFGAIPGCNPGLVVTSTGGKYPVGFAEYLIGAFVARIGDGFRFGYCIGDNAGIKPVCRRRSFCTIRGDELQPASETSSSAMMSRATTGATSGSRAVIALNTFALTNQFTQLIHSHGVFGAWIIAADHIKIMHAKPVLVAIFGAKTHRQSLGVGRHRLHDFIALLLELG